MTHAEAEQTADAAIAEIERQRRADVIGARCRDRGRPRRCRLDIFRYFSNSPSAWPIAYSSPAIGVDTRRRA
jgi:hypothetical protein